MNLIVSIGKAAIQATLPFMMYWFIAFRLLIYNAGNRTYAWNRIYPRWARWYNFPIWLGSSEEMAVKCPETGIPVDAV